MAGTLASLKVGEMLDKVTHTKVAVKQTSTLAVAANNLRRYLLIVNDSDETIYIAHGVPAQMNFGMRIERDGGFVVFSQDKNNLCYHAIFAIQAKPTTKTLLITEGE